jgi:catechol 2,3-dioxygenase-like lactoylglutathione lyase family enzyme
VKRLISSLILSALCAAVPLRAQLAAPNEMGVSMGHIHLHVKDVDSERTFWIALGGTPMKVGAFEVMKFPGTLVFLSKPAQPEPGGGSEGSVVNHIGFQVPNVQESVAKWKAAGLRVVPGNRPQQAFVFTPDDVKIEILEDQSLTVPIKFHHIHFYVAADQVKAIQAWYAKMFGAKPGMRGQFQADDLPGVNLTFATSPTPTVGTKGRALDHIGFEVRDLEAFCKKLEANGVKLDRPYQKAPIAGLTLAFITDPWGTSIELNEGLDKL